MLRAAQAVLERVTSAIENELPYMMLETVISGETERMVRVSHSTAMDEPVYVRVTAHGLTTREARRMFPDDPDTKVAALKAEARAKADTGMAELLEQRATEARMKDAARIKEAAQNCQCYKGDLNLLGEPHATAAEVAAVCCPRCRLASKYKTGCDNPECQCHQPKSDDGK